jgi:FtsH-binding integral membrane protein
VVPVLLLFFGGGGLLLVVGVRMWSRGELDVRLLGVVAAASFVLIAATVANGLPEITASFEPALGWPLQFWGWVFAGVLGSAAGAGALGLAAAVARTWLPRDGGRIAPPGLGVVAVGAVGLASALSSRVLADPSRPNRAFEGIGDALPSFTPLAGGVLEFVAVLTALLLLGAAYREARGRPGIRFVFEMGVGLIAATVLATSWPDGAAAAAVSTIAIVVALHLFGWLFAQTPSTAVEAAAAVTLTGLVTSVIDPGFPGQALGAAFGATAVLVLTWIVWRRMAGAAH